jgi:XLF-Cernunnos, XRcc4-like factor, NHEJ component
MATEIREGWIELKAQRQPRGRNQCPKLFYNYSASSKGGINLLLTDLISLWRSTLSPEDIISVAAEHRASIDPSESDEQMSIFQTKLGFALEGGKNKLTKAPSTESENGTLLLRTNLDLPKPLKPLEWIFTLATESAAELAEYILRPTLHHLSTTQGKLELLIGVIKEKDHVIEKLLDRVADKGTDMSMIFPKLTGISKRGAGGVKVEDAKKLVPGMQRFSREEWEKDVESRKEGGEGSGMAADVSLVLGLEELVKGCEKCFSHTKEEHEGWTSKLADGKSLETSQSGSLPNKSQSQTQNPSQLGKDSGTESENEFETQATPPQLKKRRGQDLAEHDSSSAEDVDGDGNQPAKKKPRLGALRNERLKSNSAPATENSSSHPSHHQLSNQNDKPPNKPQATPSDTSTASETEPETEPRRSRLEKPQTNQYRLGRLKTTPNTDDILSPNLQDKLPDRSPSPPTRPTTADSNHSTASRRLGRIGRLKKSTQSPSHEATRSPHGDDGIEKSQKGDGRGNLGKIELRNKKKQTDISDESAKTAAHERDWSIVPDDDKPQDRSGEPRDVDSDATASPSPSPSPSGAPSPSKSAIPPLDSSQNGDRTAEKQDIPAKSQEASESHLNLAEKAAKQPETEQEKVIRRREELKRTIQTGPSDQKSIGTGLGGTKKKRRF